MSEANAHQQKLEQMLNSPVEGLVCRMAVPSIIIMLISAMYNMADTYFVGSIGTSATAAVGVVYSVMALIQALGFFFGHGTGNYISRQLGAGHTEVAETMAATGFFSAVLAGAALAVLGLANLESLALLLGATPTSLPHAMSYLRFILIGTPFMAASLVLNNLLRFQGSTFYGMIGMTTGAILNIALDPLFIFVFDMGVAGAGLATMISQAVSCCVLLVCSNLPGNGNIPVWPKNFSPALHRYKEMIRGGTPSLFRQGIGSVAVICLNQVAGPYGDAAIAALSIVSRVAMFAASALLGFGQGFQPVCGFNYGAGRYDRVRKAFWFCVRISFFVLAALAVVGFVFAPGIIGTFRNDPEVVAIGTLPMRLQCLTFPFMGWVVMSNMMLQTIGKAVKASLLALARQGLFYIPLLFLLSGTLGLRGLQLTQPTSDLVSLLFSIPLVTSVLREMKDAQQGQEARQAAGEAPAAKAGAQGGAPGGTPQ